MLSFITIVEFINANLMTKPFILILYIYLPRWTNHMPSYEKTSNNKLVFWPGDMWLDHFSGQFKNSKLCITLQMYINTSKCSKIFVFCIKFRVMTILYLYFFIDVVLNDFQKNETTKYSKRNYWNNNGSNLPDNNQNYLKKKI